MRIYQDNGYIDIEKILSLNIPFTFIVGGRGTGKTYTSLKLLCESDTKFMFIRRTQSQVDLVNKPEFSPFKSLNRDLGINIITSPISKYNAGIYKSNEDREIGNAMGYTGALSTFSNIRGFDATDVELMIYDEFIPEKHERPIKNEGVALLNAYETVNRNREVNGKKPLQLLCLANSNDLANSIFMELSLVRKAEQMRRKHQEVYIDRQKGICLILLDKSPISSLKKNTALYRLTNGSNFEKMALDNAFSGEEIGNINSQPLKEYRPIVSVGEITIYEHKSKSEFYITTHRAGSVQHYGSGDTERARFKRVYSWLWDAYLENNIVFEEYLCEVLLTKVFL